MKKEHNFWIYFLLLLFPYIGIPAMWCKRKAWSKNRKIFLTGLSVIWVIYAFSQKNSSGTTASASDAISTAKPTSKPTAKPVEKPKSTVKDYNDDDSAVSTGGLKLKLSEISTYTDSLFKAESGNYVIKISFEIENTGITSRNIDSDDFNLCTSGGYTCKYFPGDGVFCEDKLAAGKKLKGNLYYQVPEGDTKGLELEWSPNALGIDSKTFKLNSK